MTKEQIEYQKGFVSGRQSAQKEFEGWLEYLSLRLERANDEVPEANYKFWDYMKRIRENIQAEFTKLKSATTNDGEKETK